VAHEFIPVMFARTERLWQLIILLLGGCKVYTVNEIVQTNNFIKMSIDFFIAS
jgi:hypothetical protein